MSWLVGVDVGGTFTDFFASNLNDGGLRYFKRPSTPGNPGEAIVRGLQEMCAALSIDPATIERICHGTTVATNALIQRRGGTVAMVTTKGFRDLLEIGRQIRPHMYSLQEDQPDPLIPRKRRFEIAERIQGDGGVLIAPEAADIDGVVDAVAASGANACAVCGLFSFLNGSHEQAIGAALREKLPDVQVSLSSEVRPEFREYERFSTTVLNAYLQPVMTAYLDYLGGKLGEMVPDAPVRIYQSSGGLMSLDTSKQFPIRTALSGPAAGAVGAVATGKAVGRPNTITLDMGGTSADVALIRNDDAGISLERDVAGFPVRLPMVDIHTVGAGGGSIAWFDRDGLLKVGPNSAGADPGPACYGLGGTEPTVTDANLALGRLSTGGLIGGEMALDLDASRKALSPIADKMGFSIEKTAQGILGIVVANMVRAVRTISVERGLDPRDYALMPFGGAGPLHAIEVARVLNMREIVVPVAPGILCAQGLIVSDLREEFVRSGRFAADTDGEAAIRAHLEDLERDARAWFGTEEVEAADQRLSLTFDARYVGQNFELPVEFPADTPGELATPKSMKDIVDGFHAAHERYYGFASVHEPVEVINIRISASGRLGDIAEPEAADASGETPEPAAHRPVWFDGDEAVETPVYKRDTLAPGMTFQGPAIVEQLDSTTVIFPGDRVEVHPSLNLLITLAAQGASA